MPLTAELSRNNIWLEAGTGIQTDVQGFAVLCMSHSANRPTRTTFNSFGASIYTVFFSRQEEILSFLHIFYLFLKYAIKSIYLYLFGCLLFLCERRYKYIDIHLMMLYDVFGLMMEDEMKIKIAADHGGFELKEKIKAYYAAKGIVLDDGTYLRVLRLS